MSASVTSLYCMTPRAKKAAVDPAIGRALKAQRVRMGLTQEQVVEQSEGKLYPRLVSELETGKRNISEVSLEQALVYASILGYSPEALAADSRMPQLPVKTTPTDEYRPTLALPMFGDVAAGLNPGDVADEIEKFYIDPSITGIRGRPAARLAVMRVNGDSMVSPKMSNSIPKGSLIVVERNAVAQSGDTVVAWIRELDLSVLKKFEEGDEAVLTSLNPSGPVFRAGDHDFEIRGVVRLIIKSP